MKKSILYMILALMIGLASLGRAETLADGDDLTGGSYAATEADESAVEISGEASAALTGATIEKPTGDASSADAASFRGVNAAVRVYDGAALTLKDCTILADADNATGVFAYNGGVVRLSSCAVTVTGGGAGGVQVAGGGTLVGEDLTVTSASKAAIRSDRGGGTMVLTGGSYTATGKNGCPAIYSTADITVSDALCASERSRAVIIEGKNSVTLNDCVLTGNDQSSKENSVHANVLLYQSASGDAGEGVSVFTMNGGEMTCLNGAMFYCTNTESVVNLSGAKLNLSQDGTLLIAAAGRWGKDGKNGGRCALNASGQALEGDIEVDALSEVTLSLADGGSYVGAIRSEGTVRVTLEAGCTWTLTGDSAITAFEGDLADVDTNGYALSIG